MSIADAVRSAKNPQEAMLAIAEALDRIESLVKESVLPDPWGEWASQPSTAEPLTTVVEGEDGEMIVTFATTADQAKKDKRAELANTALAELFGQVEEFVDGTPTITKTPDDELVHAFIEGGPLWLDAWDHQAVMGLPRHVKIALIEDVHEDSPEEGAALGRDLLKEMGPGAGVPDRWTNAEAA